MIAIVKVHQNFHVQYKSLLTRQKTFTHLRSTETTYFQYLFYMILPKTLKVGTFKCLAKDMIHETVLDKVIQEEGLYV